MSLPLVAAEILLHQNEWILEVGRDAMSLSFSHVDAPHKIDTPNRKESRVKAEHNAYRTTVRFSKCLGKEEQQEAASSAQTAPIVPCSHFDPSLLTQARKEVSNSFSPTRSDGV